MRRMNSMEKEGTAFRGMSAGRERRTASGLVLVGFLMAMTPLIAVMPLLLAAPAAATPATVDSVFGFDEAGLEGLDSGVMTVEDDFLMAGDGSAGTAGLDVVLSGSTNHCVFTASDPTCRSSASGISGAYSGYVTVTVEAVQNPAIDGPFTLFLSGLGGNYAANEVVIELDSTVPAGLDTSGIDGFNSVALGHVLDETFGTPAAYHYVGWQVQVGDTFSFRYDVLTGANGRLEPQFTANAIARAIVPRVIPEPGTALLMGLGLAGLSAAQRRLAPTHR